MGFCRRIGRPPPPSESPIVAALARFEVPFQLGRAASGKARGTQLLDVTVPVAGEGRRHPHSMD